MFSQTVSVAFGDILFSNILCLNVAVDEEQQLSVDRRERMTAHKEYLNETTVLKSNTMYDYSAVCVCVSIYG